MIVLLGLLIINYQNISHLILYYLKNTIVFLSIPSKESIKICDCATRFINCQAHINLHPWLLWDAVDLISSSFNFLTCTCELDFRLLS